MSDMENAQKVKFVTILHDFVTSQFLIIYDSHCTFLRSEICIAFFLLLESPSKQHKC